MSRSVTPLWAWRGGGGTGESTGGTVHWWNTPFLSHTAISLVTCHALPPSFSSRQPLQSTCSNSTHWSDSDCQTVCGSPILSVHPPPMYSFSSTTTQCGDHIPHGRSLCRLHLSVRGGCNPLRGRAWDREDTVCVIERPLLKISHPAAASL